MPPKYWAPRSSRWSELIGSGPLDPLLADRSVTDVLVSAPDRVWVDRGGGLELTGVSFPDAVAVRRLAQRLAAVAGRRLDDARPWVDARLADGTRLHAVLPPVAVGCTCLSLRVVRPRAFTLDELTAAGTVPPGGDRILRALLGARLSFLVSGGTGPARRPCSARCWDWSVVCVWGGYAEDGGEEGNRSRWPGCWNGPTCPGSPWPRPSRGSPRSPARGGPARRRHGHGGPPSWSPRRWVCASCPPSSRSACCPW
ncbi:hypothetical protein SHIRM173S_09404 [Streptomyces hirsutus]